jgi:hypothetical protein
MQFGTYMEIDICLSRLLAVIKAGGKRKQPTQRSRGCPNIHSRDDMKIPEAGNIQASWS